MNKTDRPAWLKRMDDGTIGEARSKAFLMDRFWILERSVDIDGADLIIQRKITGANLLDKDPPRFGVVQVKFYSDINTTRYIHKEYLIDEEGKTRNEFFLMCHSGFESEIRTYLFDAKEIIENCELAPEGHSREGRYIIPGRKLLATGEFRITSSRLALDRIERALRLATFEKNRRFLSWALPSVSIKNEYILPVYLEPIENWWGNIPEAFGEMKKKAQSFLFDLEDVHSQFKEIIESSDPEKALEIAEEMDNAYRGGDRLYLSLPKLYDEDFQKVVFEHKNKCDKLKKMGILDSFIEFKDSLLKYISTDLGPKIDSLEKNIVYEIKISYEPKTLKIISINSKYVPEEIYWKEPLKRNDRISLYGQENSGVKFVGDGDALVYWLPGRYGYGDKKDGQSWEEYFRHFSIYPISDLMQKMYDLILIRL